MVFQCTRIVRLVAKHIPNSRQRKGQITHVADLLRNLRGAIVTGESLTVIPSGLVCYAEIMQRLSHVRAITEPLPNQKRPSQAFSALCQAPQVYVNQADTLEGIREVLEVTQSLGNPRGPLVEVQRLVESPLIGVHVPDIVKRAGHPRLSANFVGCYC